jgi:hypothetical protein
MPVILSAEEEYDVRRRAVGRSQSAAAAVAGRGAEGGGARGGEGGSGGGVSGAGCSKRSLDERSDIRDSLNPAYRCAHAGYLLFSWRCGLAITGSEEKLPRLAGSLAEEFMDRYCVLETKIDVSQPHSGIVTTSHQIQ